MSMLTHLVCLFKQHGIDYVILETEMIQFICHHVRRRYKLDIDTIEDFVAYFYHIIHRIIDRFIYIGLPFELFFIKTIHWKLLTFLHLRAEQERNKKLCNIIAHNNFDDTKITHHYDEMAVAENQPFDIEKYRSAITYRNRSIGENNNYLLKIVILALKTSEFINESQLAKIADLTGYHIHWLHNTVQRLRHKVMERRTQLSRLQIRRNKLFLKILSLERDYAATSPYFKDERDRIFAEIGINRAIMVKLVNRIRGFRSHPTSKEIGEELDLSKNQVNNALIIMRKELKLRDTVHHI